MLKKICLMPVILVLGIAEILVKIIIKLECWIAGIGLLIIGLCVLLAVFNQMWLQLGILTGVLLAGVLVMLLSAEIQVGVEMLLDRMKAF